VSRLLAIGGIVSGLFIAAYIAYQYPFASLQEQYKLTPENQLKVGLVQNATRIGLLAHQMVNELRAAEGLKPLVWDDELSRVATGHSQDMVAREYFAHDDPEGRGHPYRYQEHGYRCMSTSGENIYKQEGLLFGYSDERIAESAVIGWMNSEGHRRNILYDGFNKEGIGVHIVPNLSVYVTQNFC
jgi:uncharacterized protein YkwD